MRETVFFSLLFFVVLGICDGQPVQNPYRNSKTQETFSPDKSLLLDFHHFDQTAKDGWRYWCDEGKYHEAAQLIESYLKLHPELSEFQNRLLHFHTGQMYACGNEYELAQQHLKDSFASETLDSGVEWNDYVRAIIAFLKKDKRSLIQYRKRIAKGPRVAGKVLNLDVVDSLIANFNKPYSVVCLVCYSAPVVVPKIQKK